MFMTDTARHADVVLPCTSVLEEEDIIYTGMFSFYINFSAKAVDPPKGVMSEYEFFKMLAERMGIAGYPFISPEDFLKGAIQPLKEKFGVGYQALKNKYCFSLPGTEIPWQDGVFKTPSGKYELYSQRALKDGQSPLPVFVEEKKGDKQYPLRLITPHPKNSLHSQHFAFVDDKPEAYLHSKTLQACLLENGDLARVCSPQGELLVRVQSDDHISDNMVMIYQGWWHKSGSVNFLTQSGISDMGEQAAYYDCFCRIEQVL
jgi:anaerobic selenocysteine-containing dehydrogenase